MELTFAQALAAHEATFRPPLVIPPAPIRQLVQWGILQPLSETVWAVRGGRILESGTATIKANGREAALDNVERLREWLSREGLGTLKVLRDEFAEAGVWHGYSHAIEVAVPVEVTALLKG
jgi:hypothetical protein